MQIQIDDNRVFVWVRSFFTIDILLATWLSVANLLSYVSHHVDSDSIESSCGTDLSQFIASVDMRYSHLVFKENLSEFEIYWIV